MLPDDLLLQVQKPARYIGKEWNAVKKDFDKAFIRFAFCFPDLYEVGMSNFGIRILYGILNEMDDVACERVFHPASDMEELMRRNYTELVSLESQRSLRDFDIIGFSLGYELCYTNVLNMLELAGIPMYAAQRNSSHPLIIAGGSCVLNPEPMADFIDAFVIGEGEDTIKEIVEACRSAKGAQCVLDRNELLHRLASIEGVYVPLLYRVEYNPDGTLREFSPREQVVPYKVTKRIVKDLNQAFFPVKWYVPYIQTIHDRITLEVMRGCPNRCRFCQARSFYFPYRQREPRLLLDLAKKAYGNTGYEEISLLGLSVTDYYKVEPLLEELIGAFKDKGVSISLPSIKARDITSRLLSLITKVKKSGLTLAPEAATDRLRKVIDKDFNLNEFFSAIEHAYKLGYKHIKLYFMIGLPTETEVDVDGILDLSHQVSQLKKKIDYRAAEVNLSIATFIPKPHTPFQWLAMESLDGIKAKQCYINAKAKSLGHKIKISFHNRYMSFLEAVLSRGDRKLSEVIFRAWKKGCKFDAWSDSFSFERWLEAFKESDIDANFYILRQRAQDELFPWDFIDAGLGKGVLWEELNRALTYTGNGSNI